MNTRGVCKRVGAHNSLVGLHHKTGRLTHHAAGRKNVFGIDAHLKAKIVFACFHRHDDFLQRAVAGTFAQSIDGALHLPCTTDLHTGQ